jgi:hypothetical protein
MGLPSEVADCSNFPSDPILGIPIKAVINTGPAVINQFKR